ncbi:MAG: UTP--glucose-1-phosphate uridylyltransferase [Caldilineaceae bacterium]
MKDGLSFLDIVARQILHLRRQRGARAIGAHEQLQYTRRIACCASSVPWISPPTSPGFFATQGTQDPGTDLSPAEWPADEDKEWCPPGHGDIYPALISSGMLRQCLDAGYEYAFVSNIDNLGATVDEEILGYFAQERLPFLMEVTQRTAADRKGGHPGCGSQWAISCCAKSPSVRPTNSKTFKTSAATATSTPTTSGSNSPTLQRPR